MAASSSQGNSVVTGRTVGDGDAGKLRVAAGDASAHAAHEGNHFLAAGKPVGWIGGHQAGALDAADLRRLGPFSRTHVSLSVVDAKSLDLDDHLTGLWPGSGAF